MVLMDHIVARVKIRKRRDGLPLILLFPCRLAVLGSKDIALGQNGKFQHRVLISPVGGACGDHDLAALQLPVCVLRVERRDVPPGDILCQTLSPGSGCRQQHDPPAVFAVMLQVLDQHRKIAVVASGPGGGNIIFFTSRKSIFPACRDAEPAQMTLRKAADDLLRRKQNVCLPRHRISFFHPVRDAVLKFRLRLLRALLRLRRLIDEDRRVCRKIIKQRHSIRIKVIAEPLHDRSIAEVLESFLRHIQDFGYPEGLLAHVPVTELL